MDINLSKTKLFRFLFFFTTGIFLLGPFFYTFFPFKTVATYEDGRDFTPDVHPLYASYAFVHSRNIINIGIQPLYSPTGLILEAIKRDRILAEAMAKLGLRIQYFSFLKGRDVNHFLKNGDLHGGVGGELAALSLASTKEIIVPSIVQSGFTSIVAKRDIFINEIHGRRIGYVPESISHFALRKALSSEGLTEADVTLVPMDVTEIPEALENGVIDAFSAWEPTPAVILKIYSGLETIYKRVNSGFFYFSKKFFINRPEAVRNILAAELRAVRWIKSDKKNLFQASEWAILAGDKFTEGLNELSPLQGVELALRDLFMTSSVPLIPGVDISEKKRLEESFLFLKKNQQIPAGTNWEKIKKSFDGNILHFILSSPEKYRLNEFNYRKK
ncbi:MAG: ABC transporter substrate-binding protein [Nitrospinota bacterium]